MKVKVCCCPFHISSVISITKLIAKSKLGLLWKHVSYHLLMYINKLTLKITSDSWDICKPVVVYIWFVCVGVVQDQAFGELEKNSDKLQQGTSSNDSSQPAHLHQLLCSLQKQLLAYCHINSVTEVWTVFVDVQPVTLSAPPGVQHSTVFCHPVSWNMHMGRY